MSQEYRPWGFYEVLSDNHDHKVKRITVYPDKRLSYQRHQKRSEHWYILRGQALITLNDNNYAKSSGESIDIAKAMKHRIANTGTENLVFIEVQTGTYFGEDDIERFEDDFGRI